MSEEARGEFYFNVETRQVEQGKVSAWPNRMGPYATRAEAEAALETAAARTAQWDAEDARDDDWGRKPGR